MGREDQIKIEWNSGYSVRIDEFDDQHRVLFQAIDDLLQAIQMGSTVETIEDVMARLMDFTRDHFAREERFLEEHGYPDLESHKREHGSFVNRIAEYQELIHRGEIRLSLTMLEFLVQWLTRHILGTDRKYTAYFEKQGLISDPK